MEVLEGESPDIVTVEMSEYGVSFRESIGLHLKERLLDILHVLRERPGRKNRRELDTARNPSHIGPVEDILLTLELPFEFRAVKTYCRRKRIPFRCIDLSNYSRDKLKKLEEEMITEENVRKTLALGPVDFHEELRKQRTLARRLNSRDADQFLIQTFLDGKPGDGFVQRDRYMSLRIKEVLKTHRKTLHVAGWEHLLDDPMENTLYGLLKGLRPKRILAF